MAIQAEHVLVCGPSGGGKTTFLRELHDRHDGVSAFLTTKGNERKAAKDPPGRVRKSSCAYPADIHKAREWGLRRPELAQIIVDECDNAPTFKDGADGPVRKMLHEDREGKIKCVIATQNPQDLRTNQWNYGPLQQCKTVVWVGPTRTWHRGFREWLNLDADQLPETNYRWHAIQPSDPPRVIERGRTKKQYS